MGRAAALAFAAEGARRVVADGCRAEEIAPLAIYLASDESSFVTGAHFRIDGGTIVW